MTMPKIKVNIANDLGYGSVKALANDHSYLIPSTAAILRAQDEFDPAKFERSSQLAEYMVDFMDHLDVSVQSAQVKETRRMFLGKAAIRSRLHADNFNVNNFEGKAETDLALILTLATIAGQAVKDSYKEINTRKRNNLTEFPFTDIHVDVDMATALPITEAKRPGEIDKYRARFMNNNHQHLVIFHNFDQLITVHIKFKKVEIAYEGETALYKIRHANRNLAKLIKQDFVKAYPELKNQITNTDLLTKRPNALIIDIGEGTTDFAVFTNGRINEMASSSLKQGFGIVLEAAIADLQQNGFNISNRSDLQQQLNEPKTLFNASRLDREIQAVQAQLEPFEKAITKQFGQALHTAGANIDIVYVLGGGATPMNQMSHLRADLIEESKAQTGGLGIYTIFIDPLYSQLLNEAGLKLILDTMEEGED